VTTRWIEVGDRVFVRRYAFLDQSVGAVLGPGGVVLVDTRASLAQAGELERDLRALTRLPVTAVVNTHGHADHAFGNAAFRPTAVWAHAGCPGFLVRTWAAQRGWLRETFPDRMAEFDGGAPDLPVRLVEDQATIDLGGRVVEVRHLGRGHTDHDVVVVVPDARVILAGDLVENGAPPSFEDAFPIDWPGAVDRLADLLTPDQNSWVVVPGHGEPAGAAFVAGQAALLHAVAGLAEDVRGGTISLPAAIRLVPFDGPAARIALERAVRQLRGELA
jgi:glyoxylase-like metal-dependent hydrolase (beta-lactamase superfamily II)